MRILIGSRTPDRIFHWEELARHLSALGAECKVVNNMDVVDGFPTKKIRKWMPSTRRFDALVGDFNPDVILTDGLRHFGLAALKSGIPLIVHLTGDFWSEIQIARETLYKSFPRNLVIGRIERMGEEILRGARVVMPNSAYLDGIVRERLPAKPTYVMGHAMDSSEWHPEKGMTLEHPCVGLVQKASIWGKAKEMLVLNDVLERLPNVTFYWAGSGPYAEKILHELERHPNFKGLGAIDYPEGIRRFLSEIDIYALFTGLDMAPTSLREALLMEKPAVATNIGGVPEIMKNETSGLLVNAGDSDGIVEKISYLLDNPDTAMQMGKHGRKNTVEDTTGENIARGFIEFVTTELDMQ